MILDFQEAYRSRRETEELEALKAHFMALISTMSTENKLLLVDAIFNNDQEAYIELTRVETIRNAMKQINTNCE